MRNFVAAGQGRVGRGRGVLAVAGLGSCVAVVLYDAQARVGGLAHALLPDPTYSTQRERCWRYVATAVPELIHEMVVAGADRRRIEARIVGGSSMFRDIMPKDQPNIGERNVRAAEASLEQAGVPIVGQQVGGDYGRSLEFDLADGTLRVSSQGRNRVEL